MYIPEHYEESDPAVLQALVQAHPFGTWITLGRSVGIEKAGALAALVEEGLQPKQES